MHDATKTSGGLLRQTWWRARDYASVLAWQASGIVSRVDPDDPAAARAPGGATRRPGPRGVRVVALPAPAGHAPARPRCAGPRAAGPGQQPPARPARCERARSVPRRARPARRRRRRAQQGRADRQARHAAGGPRRPDRLDDRDQHPVRRVVVRALVRRPRRCARSSRATPPSSRSTPSARSTTGSRRCTAGGTRTSRPGARSTAPPRSCSTRRGTSVRWRTRACTRSCWSGSSALTQPRGSCSTRV